MVATIYISSPKRNHPTEAMNETKMESAFTTALLARDAAMAALSASSTETSWAIINDAGTRETRSALVQRTNELYAAWKTACENVESERRKL